MITGQRYQDVSTELPCARTSTSKSVAVESKCEYVHLGTALWDTSHVIEAILPALHLLVVSHLVSSNLTLLALHAQGKIFVCLHLLGCASGRVEVLAHFELLLFL